MYEPHFGLAPRPFAETRDPSAFLPLPSRVAALRRLRYGLECGPGPVAMSGASGSGKTMLAAALARALGGLALRVTFPAMPPADLLAFLADELDAPPDAAPGMAGSVRRIRSRLAALVARGDRPLLIVDEADLIAEPGTFEALRLLLNFETGAGPDLRLLLVGGPDLGARMPAAFLDRLEARCALAGFTESESASYVLGRLARAGASSPLFGPEALRALHRASEGLPRRLNRLADLALLIAFARDAVAADAEAVALAARDASFEGLAA